LQLIEDHRNVEQLWNSIAPAVDAFLEGRAGQLDLTLFTRLIRDYSRHFLYEESEFLPIARTILDPALRNCA
jgi:hypothetical protein